MARTLNKIETRSPMPAPLLTENSTLAAEKKQQAAELKDKGELQGAVSLMKEALVLDSTLADVHFSLAMLHRTHPALNINMDAINKSLKDKDILISSYRDILTILKKRRQYKEALICQDQLCKLLPNNVEEAVNMSLLLNVEGLKADAIRSMAEATLTEPNNKLYKSLFIHTCGNAGFQQHEPAVKKCLQLFFDNIYDSSLGKAFPVWLEIVYHDPDCIGFQKAIQCKDHESFDKWIENAPEQELNFLKDKFFLDGLRLLTMAEPVIERFLVRARRYLCQKIGASDNPQKFYDFAPFLYALAEQCFLNEYVFSTEAGEEIIAYSLIQKSSEKRFDESAQKLAYALYACYAPLYPNLKDHQKELKNLRRSDPAFKKLVKAQFFDLLLEEELTSGLKKFGELEDQVSKNVQAQYEENPYPRWVAVCNYAAPNDDLPMPLEQRDSPRKVLIAGCGTGRQAIMNAAVFPSAKITAIDISRTSLAYAQRKAIEAGVADRIDFIHADILSMREWPEEFDVIASSGVLHHMDDPYKGWETLVSRLKSGGFFNVGLYSETARKHIVEAREYVKQAKFQPTVADIRTCREHILGLPKDHPMRQTLTNSNDFYSTSQVRDLIFHVQEHRMTLPQIQIMLDKLGLTPLKFTMRTVDMMKKYDAMFPKDIERKSLENWHILEQKYPETFVGMYQFWSKKL